MFERRTDPLKFFGRHFERGYQIRQTTFAAEFEPIAREHRALLDIYMNPALLKDKPSVPYFDEDKS